MRKTITILATVSFYLTIAITIVIFVVAALELGYILLEHSSMVRPKDWWECKIGLPIVGAAIGAFAGSAFGVWVEEQILKLRKSDVKQ